MRIRLIELLIVVGVIAFAMVSLNRADPLFETLFFSFTLLTILAAILMAIGRRGGARAFWIGFAVTSSTYLAFAHLPDSEESVPRHNGPEITTQLLRHAFNWLHGDEDGSSLSPPSGIGFFSVPDDRTASRDSDDPFAADSPDESTVTPNPTFDDLIDLIDIPIAESDDREPAASSANLNLVFGGGQRVISSGDSTAFMRIGHCAWALLLGWIAGHFTRYVYERSRRHPTLDSGKAV